VGKLKTFQLLIELKTIFAVQLGKKINQKFEAIFVESLREVN
jgi:hypothetical protein